MVSWIIPIVRQSKTDLIHRQEMRPLRHGGSHFVNLLIAWRLVLSMKPWSYIWLEFGLFSTIIAIIRACACWALFVVTLTNTVHLIYIYIWYSVVCFSPAIYIAKYVYKTIITSMIVIDIDPISSSNITYRCVCARRRNPSALAMELRLSCTIPWIYRERSLYEWAYTQTQVHAW